MTREYPCSSTGVAAREKPPWISNASRGGQSAFARAATSVANFRLGGCASSAIFGTSKAQAIGLSNAFFLFRRFLCMTGRCLPLLGKPGVNYEGRLSRRACRPVGHELPTVMLIKHTKAALASPHPQDTASRAGRFEHNRVHHCVDACAFGRRIRLRCPCVQGVADEAARADPLHKQWLGVGRPEHPAKARNISKEKMEVRNGK